MSVNVDQKLGLNKFTVDEEHPHITVTAGRADRAELQKLMNACPAGLYHLNEDGTIRFDYAGCLECGTCRVLCGKTLLDKWQFPEGTFGVAYRYG
ncbi:MAG: ferredoxin family protein [Sporolactobacillus sp.]